MCSTFCFRRSLEQFLSPMAAAIIVTSSSEVYACALYTEAPAYRAAINCPADVTDLVERIATCAHLGAEEPHDIPHERGTRHAMANSRCDAVECDIDRLLAKYKTRPRIEKVIRQTWDDLYRAERSSGCESY
jgi:hypothetical protein